MHVTTADCIDTTSGRVREVLEHYLGAEGTLVYSKFESTLFYFRLYGLHGCYVQFTLYSKAVSQ